MKMRNIDGEQYIKALEPLLNRTDIIGYAAARNTRIISESISDYTAKRDELIMKYGEQTINSNGQVVGGYSMNQGMVTWDEFVTELEPLAAVEIDVPVFQVSRNDAVGAMTGAQMLALEWMVHDLWDEI